MATYCFTCPACSLHAMSPSRDMAGAACPFCGEGTMRRDYRAENASPAVVGLKRERERGGSSAVRDLFLPTAKELAGPGDPDGHKAIRQWNDEHDPKPGNARPMRPEAPKAVF